MRRLVDLLRGRAGRGAMAISAGVGAGQVVVFLVSPILTRLYDPAVFGQYAILVSLLAVLTIPATLRLEAAVPLAGSDAEARDVLVTGLFSTFVLMVIVGVIVFEFRYDLLGYFPQMSEAALWCLVPGVAAFAGYELMTQYAIRQRKYGAVGVRSLVQNVGIATSQVGLGFGGVSSGLNWGQIFGKLLAVGFLVPLVSHKIERQSPALGPFGVLRKFARFPLLAAPSSLFNTLGTQAPYLLVGLLFGSPAIGFLGLIQRLVAAPQALVGQAIGQVYVGEVAQVVRGGCDDLLRPFLRASKMLVMVALPLLLGMVLVPDSLLAAIFGSEWSGAAQYVQAAGPAFAAQLIVAPVSQTLILANRQGLQLGWDVLRLILVAGAIGGAWYWGGSALHATWAYSAAACVSYFLLWVLCRSAAVRFSKERRGEI